MDMKDVESSNIGQVGYDKDARRLRVAFKSGGTHDYTGVPPDVHAELLSAPSIGRYFHENVRSKFASEKAEEAPQPIRDTGSAPINQAPDDLDSAIRRFNTPPERP